MKHLTAGQHALLEADLEQLQRQLDRRLSEHHGGLSRVEHAHELLLQNGLNAPQREGDRALDLALSDRETQQLNAVGAALLRMKDGSYGACADCAADIPLDRLKAEPWALRCVACETRQEEAARRGAG